MESALVHLPGEAQCWIKLLTVVYSLQNCCQTSDKRFENCCSNGNAETMFHWLWWDSFTQTKALTLVEANGITGNSRIFDALVTAPKCRMQHICYTCSIAVGTAVINVRLRLAPNGQVLSPLGGGFLFLGQLKRCESLLSAHTTTVDKRYLT